MPSPGRLAESIVVRGVTIPAGSTLIVDEDLDCRAFTLAHATVVHGVEVAAGSTLSLAAFPPPITFNLLLLPLYPWVAWRCFWDDVAPRTVEVLLAAPVRIGDLDAHAGDRVWLDRNGLRSIMLRSPRVIAGYELQTGTVAFATNGRPREIVLYRSQRLGAIPCHGSGLVGTEVLLDDAGQVRRCVLSETMASDGRRYPAGTRVTFDHRGRIVRAKARARSFH